MERRNMLKALLVAPVMPSILQTALAKQATPGPLTLEDIRVATITLAEAERLQNQQGWIPIRMQNADGTERTVAVIVGDRS